MFANMLLNSGFNAKKWSKFSLSNQFLRQTAQNPLPVTCLGNRETLQMPCWGGKSAST